MIKRVSDPQDRRIVFCELTGEGSKELKGYDREVRDRVLPVIDTWSTEQLEVVVSVMEQFLDSDAK